MFSVLDSHSAKFSRRAFFPEKTENSRRKLDTLVKYVDIQVSLLVKFLIY